jgi:hypothetical protein
LLGACTARLPEAPLPAGERFFFILAGVPIDDTGGGAAAPSCPGAAAPGLCDLYINRFLKYESESLT